MAITLNLLPQDQIVSGSLGKFLKISKSLSVIFFAIFILFAIGMTIFIITNNSKLKSLTSNVSSLKEDVIALEVSEKQIFLLKDRIKKIETLKTIPSSLKNLAGTIELVNTLSPTAKVTELDLDSKKVDLTVNFKSNFEMNSFLSTVKQSKSFSSVIVSSFGLSPTTGYLISFNLLTSK